MESCVRKWRSGDVEKYMIPRLISVLIFDVLMAFDVDTTDLAGASFGTILLHRDQG